MKYALLAGYTDGCNGWHNFQAASDSVDELKKRMKPDGDWFHVDGNSEDYCNWWQIVDLTSCEIVEQGDGADL